MDLDFPPDGTPIHECGCARCQANADPATRQYHAQINLFLSRLTEPQRRWYVGLLLQAPDSPGERQLALITGLDPHTIRRGRTELAADLAPCPPLAQRRTGGGRLRAEKKIPVS
jgi:hypothetical protein